MLLSRNVKLLALSGALAVLAGCTTTGVPGAAPFAKPAAQDRIRAAGHWQVVAQDAVAQTTQLLDSAGLGAGTDIYVVEPAGASAFDRAYRQFLISELVKGGKSVRNTGDSVVLVEYQTQVVASGGAAPADQVTYGRAPYGFTELVLTTSVSSGNRYIASNSDVYYIESNDARLFARTPIPAVRSMEIVGQ